jgi:hypothetical protein
MRRPLLELLKVSGTDLAVSARPAFPILHEVTWHFENHATMSFSGLPRKVQSLLLASIYKLSMAS